MGRRVDLIGMCAVLAATLVVLPTQTALASGDIAGRGDYWEYISSLELSDDMFGSILDFDMTFDFTMEITYKLKVEGTTSMAGGEIYEIKTTGSGEASGSVNSSMFSGDLTVAGAEHRLTSNFDLVKRTMTVGMEIGIIGFQLDFNMGMEALYEPSWNDYLGDEILTLGAEFVTESTLTETRWANLGWLGEISNESETVELRTTYTVLSESVTVEVPAGTFDCYKVKAEVESDNSTEVIFYYYSEEVGNHAKIEVAVGALGTGLMDAQLKSYSYGRSSISEFFSENWWVLPILIVVAVALILAVIMSGRGRRAVAMVPPPQGMEVPGPPPPPPQNPP